MKSPKARDASFMWVAGLGILGEIVESHTRRGVDSQVPRWERRGQPSPKLREARSVESQDGRGAGNRVLGWERRGQPSPRMGEARTVESHTGRGQGQPSPRMEKARATESQVGRGVVNRVPGWERRRQLSLRLGGVRTAESHAEGRGQPSPRLGEAWSAKS
ncbi:hypothetical protein Fot_56610 [Forsythia ovata]|uniref:Uncharacterized protein n=1 Tax=Forsythia ovata TaxID=205694 RepID=A0ABD1NZ76_9LAMI